MNETPDSFEVQTQNYELIEKILCFNSNFQIKAEILYFKKKKPSKVLSLKDKISVQALGTFSDTF